jgi:alpha-ribazole phosphatase
MRQVLLIRHSATLSSILRRYAGDPFEPLAEEGIDLAKKAASNPALQGVALAFVAPALRCRESAALMLPETPKETLPFSELDFGVFKGKTADALLGDPLYEQWLESGCMADPPGGGSLISHKKEACQAFLAGMAFPFKKAAFVIHGGNIMAILERFSEPRKDFFSFQLPPCGMFLGLWESGKLWKTERIN